jgi:hypothetical protein
VLTIQGTTPLTLTFPSEPQMPAWVGQMAFSHDGSQVLLEVSGRERLYQMDGTLMQADLGIDLHPSDAIAFSPDGSLLGQYSTEGQLTLYEMGNPQARVLQRIAVPPREHTVPEARGLLVTPDNQLVITWDSYRVGIYAVASGTLLRTLPVAATGIAVGPFGRVLAIVSDGRVQLWAIPD